VAKGVFLHRSDSIYDDDPDRQYQFPDIYLSRASQCIGDWIIYLEPTKAGRRGYHATAKVSEIVPDPSRPKHYLALIEAGSYLEFERGVPFSGPSGVPERSVLNDQGRISGRAQAAMRTIPIEDFERILDLGFGEQADLLPRTPDSDEFEVLRLREDRLPFEHEGGRERMNFWTSRPIRDRVFRSNVLSIYDCRCALTGLKLINGGGRAEVEAAHIMPVEHGGPDRVANGIALCGTAHWMFDRGLITLTNDLEIMVSRQANDQDGVWSLLNKSRRALLPEPEDLRPYPRFLEWHRKHCFKR
jgi:putative restriction endonuclease